MGLNSDKETEQQVCECRGNEATTNRKPVEGTWDGQVDNSSSMGGGRGVQKKTKARELGRKLWQVVLTYCWSTSPEEGADTGFVFQVSVGSVSQKNGTMQCLQRPEECTTEQDSRFNQTIVHRIPLL